MPKFKFASLEENNSKKNANAPGAGASTSELNRKKVEEENRKKQISKLKQYQEEENDDTVEDSESSTGDPEEHKERDPQTRDIVAKQMGISHNNIDQMIEQKVNERLLKLVNIGLKHELSIENMLQYFREVAKTKLYELRRYFSDSTSAEIESILKYLYDSGKIRRDKNNWYSLK